MDQLRSALRRCGNQCDPTLLGLRGAGGGGVQFSGKKHFAILEGHRRTGRGSGGAVAPLPIRAVCRH